MSFKCECCGKQEKGIFSISIINESLGKPIEVCDSCHQLLKSYLENEEQIRQIASQEVIAALDSQIVMHGQEEEERIKKEKREALQNSERIEFQKDAFEKIKNVVNEHKEIPLMSLNGARGRKLNVYSDRCEFITDVTLGSVLSNNATDGNKTIFYKDTIGIQYKSSGTTLGYLQLENASSQMNNTGSNFFAENTFTFDHTLDETVEILYKYLIIVISEYKKLK